MRVPVKIQGVLLENLNSERMSVPFFKMIQEILSVYSINIDDFVYDCCIFLNIRKYVSEAPDAEPVYSKFLLLNFDNMMVLHYADMRENNEKKDLVPNLKKFRKESELILEQSGPLYLEASPLAKQFLSALREHRNKFEDDTFKPVSKEDRPLDCRVKSRFSSEFIKGLSSEVRNYHECLRTPLGLPFKISGQPMIIGKTWRDQLTDLLKARKFKRLKKNFKKNPFSTYEPVEVFSMKFNMASANVKLPVERHISVFQLRDGSYKFCITLKLFYFYLPRYPDVSFMCVKDKDTLDRCIFEAISLMYRMSTDGVIVRYGSIEQLIAPERIEVEENTPSKASEENTPSKASEENTPSKASAEKKKVFPPICNFHSDALCNMRENYLKAVQYDKSAHLNSFKRGLFFRNGNNMDYFFSMPYVFDVYTQIESQKHLKNPEEYEYFAGCVIEGDNVRTSFEAHKFENSDRYKFVTKGDNGEEIRNEFYPSLYYSITFTEHDYMDAHQLAFTDDIRLFLNRCAQGGLKPTYLSRPKPSFS